MMAQNYPELFDGIVAGAPSMFYPDLLFWLLWTGKQQTPSRATGRRLSDAKRAQITQRVLAACDGIDGLVDGQITNPRACRFDIDTIGPAGDKTLTADEVAVVKAMYAGTIQRTPASVSAPPARSSAPRPTGSRCSPTTAATARSSATSSTRAIRRRSTGGATRLLDDVYDESKAALTPVTAAPSPDISAFVERGGKLDPVPRLERFGRAARRLDRLLVRAHAVRAAAQSAEARRRPRDRQAHAAGGRRTPPTRSASRCSEYHRLFMLPAMGHCGGSTGPSSVGGGCPSRRRRIATPTITPSAR